MALPVVRTLTDCTIYNSTVAPYLYQLQPLPKVLAESLTNLAALKQLYLDTNPLVTAAAFSLVIAPIFLLVSEVNKNYSQVDRVWSILPTIYNLHYAVYAHLAGLSAARLDLVAAISAIWSTRLTYNYYRKGGYSIGSEDYRWIIVKNYIGSGLFFLLNIVFISLYQSLLLFCITSPTYVLLLTERLASYDSRTPALGLGDVTSASLMLGFILISFLADQQQWNFHSAKSDYQKQAKVPKGYERADLDRGFLTKGLWAYSRHPNFAAEQNVWVTLYLWSCVVTGTWYNWSGLGALQYLFLFQGSTWLTELLSSGKYPEYQKYQRKVAKFVPLPGARSAAATFSDQPTSHAVPADGDAIQARRRYDLR